MLIIECCFLVMALLLVYGRSCSSKLVCSPEIHLGSYKLDFVFSLFLQKTKTVSIFYFVPFDLDLKSIKYLV